MKHRLTLTVDGEVILAAKRHARARGVSLSSLVEQGLREVVDEVYHRTFFDGEHAPSFAARWRGRLRAADGDDPRHEALARKYL